MHFAIKILFVALGWLCAAGAVALFAGLFFHGVFGNLSEQEKNEMHIGD